MMMKKNKEMTRSTLESFFTPVFAAGLFQVGFSDAEIPPRSERETEWAEIICKLNADRKFGGLRSTYSIASRGRRSKTIKWAGFFPCSISNFNKAYMVDLPSTQV